MRLPPNPFRRALAEGRPQIGLWAGFADAYATEAMASVGYDWLMLDGEHAPNDLRSLLSQLQAAAAYATPCVVRPVRGDAALVKQLLDIGAQTLLIPMIDDAEQAAAMVAAMRYPPRGIRGVGSALARASRWNQVDRYLQTADEELCLLVQIETPKALSNLDAITQVEGVHGVFFGPSDLSAGMGHLGQPGHAEVEAAVLDGIARVRAAGKAAGVLATDPVLAKRYLDAGATFVAVGVDISLLVRGAAELLGRFRSGTAPAAQAAASGY